MADAEHLANSSVPADGGELPVLVIPGFGEGRQHTKRIVAALRRRGYDAAAFTHRDAAVLDTDPITARSQAILRYMHEQAGRRHVAAHSLGAAAVLRAAAAAPELFASLTLMQMPGQSNPQPPQRLAGNAFRKARHNDAFGSRIDTVLTTLSGAMITAMRLHRALPEVIAVSKHDATQDILAVAAHGVPVRIISSEGDELFSYTEVTAFNERIAPLVASSTISFHALSGPGATHDSFWNNPEGTAALVDEHIRALGTAAVRDILES